MIFPTKLGYFVCPHDGCRQLSIMDIRRIAEMLIDDVWHWIRGEVIRFDWVVE